MSGIFDDDANKTISNLEPLAMAIRLKGIVKDKIKHMAPVSAAGWAKELRSLIRETGDDPIRVERVLDWYDRYCDRPDATWKCRTALAFRKMFYSLEQQCLKDAQELVVMCPQAMEAAARLRALAKWRNGSDKKLDSAVKRSLDAYVEFRKKLIHSPADEEVEAFLMWVSPYMIRDPIDFTVAWFWRAYKRVLKWQGWNGDLEPFVFSETCDRLTDNGSDLAANYGDRRLWEKLIASLNKVIES